MGTTLIQLELPHIPHAPCVGEEVHLAEGYVGHITYVYPVTTIWSQDGYAGYKFHVDVLHNQCKQYRQVYMDDSAWTGLKWQLK